MGIICVYIYIYTYIHIYIYTYIHIYICTYKRGLTLLSCLARDHSATKQKITWGCYKYTCVNTYIYIYMCMGCLCNTFGVSCRDNVMNGNISLVYSVIEQQKLVYVYIYYTTNKLWMYSAIQERWDIYPYYIPL